MHVYDEAGDEERGKNKADQCSDEKKVGRMEEKDSGVERNLFAVTYKLLPCDAL